MKRRNRFDIVPQSMVFATGVVIAVIFISVILYEFDNSKEMTDAVNMNMIEVTRQVRESDITMYDGISVNGADVVNFVRKNYNDNSGNTSFETDIVLKNGVTAAVRNSSMLYSLRSKESVYFVKTTGLFSCRVSRNGNGVIDYVVFTEQ